MHELLDDIDIEASNLSQQLAVLRRVGLVAQQRTGGEVVYSINVPDVHDLLVAGRGILAKLSAAGQRVVEEAASLERR